MAARVNGAMKTSPPYLCSSLAVQMRAENAFVIILLTYLYKQNAPEHGLSWLVTCVMCGQMQPEEAPRCRGEEEKGEHSGTADSWILICQPQAAVRQTVDGGQSTHDDDSPDKSESGPQLAARSSHVTRNSQFADWQLATSSPLSPPCTSKWMRAKW